MTGTDWPGLARLALGLLGWEPEVFWRATPAELALALAGRIFEPGAAAPLSRHELRDLVHRFPDH